MLLYLCRNCVLKRCREAARPAGVRSIIAKCSQKFKEENLSVWARPDPGVYAQSFTNYTLSAEGWCKHCHSVDHISDTCPSRPKAARSIIAKCSQKFKWPSWVIYDQNFRQLTAEENLSVWARPDPGVYAQSFTNYALSATQWITFQTHAHHGQKPPIPESGLQGHLTRKLTSGLLYQRATILFARNRTGMKGTAILAKIADSATYQWRS